MSEVSAKLARKASFLSGVILNSTLQGLDRNEAEQQIKELIIDCFSEDYLTPLELIKEAIGDVKEENTD